MTTCYRLKSGNVLDTATGRIVYAIRNRDTADYAEWTAWRDTLPLFQHAPAVLGDASRFALDCYANCQVGDEVEINTSASGAGRWFPWRVTEVRVNVHGHREIRTGSTDSDTIGTSSRDTRWPAKVASEVAPVASRFDLDCKANCLPGDAVEWYHVIAGVWRHGVVKRRDAKTITYMDGRSSWVDNEAHAVRWPTNVDTADLQGQLELAHKVIGTLQAKLDHHRAREPYHTGFVWVAVERTASTPLVGVPPNTYGAPTLANVLLLARDAGYLR